MGGPGSGRRKNVASVTSVASDSPITPDSLVRIPSGTLVPLSEGSSLIMSRIQNALKKSFLGDRNPLWNDEEELTLMRDASFGTHGEVSRLLSFSGQSSPGSTVGINERFSKRYTVADMNQPRNPQAVVQLSLRYALENPFVAKALRVKADFTCKDFTHKTHHAKSKKFFDDYSRKLRLRTHLKKIVWNLYATGVCPIYWGGENGGPLQFLQVLSPAAVHFEDILGRMKLWLKVTPAMVEAVRDPEGKYSPRNRVQYQAMPRYWIDEILKMIQRGQATGLIELQEGSYTVIDYRYCPYNRAENTLDGVPLQGAFEALQRYRLLAAGDFAVAWSVKNMITLISEGDPKEDPKDYKPADNVRLAKLYQKFTAPDYAQTIFCDPTTLVRYIVPPMEVFDPQKYAQVEKEIKEVLNLPSFMWANDGKGTYGAATAEVQLLRQEIQAVRMLLEDQFFYPLYTRLRTGVGRPGFAAEDIVLPSFDQNSLRDDTLWLSQNQELYSRGALSLETLMEVFGWDFDYEMKQKQAEKDTYGNKSPDAVVINDSIAQPLWEPSAGGLQPKDGKRDKGGNPGKADSEPSGGGRNPRKTGD